MNSPWGRARVTDLLHEGAVATTYLVTMKGHDRPLAARMLKPLWSRDPARRRQYEIVLDTLKSFVHPNVVPVRGPLMAGERFGSLTEYTPSVSLDHLVGLPARQVPWWRSVINRFQQLLLPSGPASRICRFAPRESSSLLVGRSNSWDSASRTGSVEFTRVSVVDRFSSIRLQRF